MEILRIFAGKAISRLLLVVFSSSDDIVTGVSSNTCKTRAGGDSMNFNIIRSCDD